MKHDSTVRPYLCKDTEILFEGYNKMTEFMNKIPGLRSSIGRKLIVYILLFSSAITFTGLRSSIGRKLIVYILLFSSAITFIGTGLQ